MQSRRDALRTLAAGALAPALQAQHQHTEPLVQLHDPGKPKNLAASDFDLLTQLVDVILPRTETPGAADAGVPAYIDRAAGKRMELTDQIHAGLVRLKEAGFAAAGADARVAQLQALEAKSDPFFKLIKNLTIDGYYSSREGLVQELGYHGNTYLAKFEGCTHPEHGAAIDAN